MNSRFLPPAIRRGDDPRVRGRSPALCVALEPGRRAGPEFRGHPPAAPGARLRTPSDRSSSSFAERDPTSTALSDPSRDSGACTRRRARPRSGAALAPGGHPSASRLRLRPAVAKVGMRREIAVTSPASRTPAATALLDSAVFSGLTRVSRPPLNHGPRSDSPRGSAPYPSAAGSRARPPCSVSPLDFAPQVATRVYPESQTRLPTTVPVSHSLPARSRTQPRPALGLDRRGSVSPLDFAPSLKLAFRPRSRSRTRPRLGLAPKYRRALSLASRLDFAPTVAISRLPRVALRLCPRVASRSESWSRAPRLSSLPRVAISPPDFTPKSQTRVYPKLVSRSDTRERLSTLPQVAISPSDFTPKSQTRVYPKLVSRSESWSLARLASRLYPKSESRLSTLPRVAISPSDFTPRSQLGLALRLPRASLDFTPSRDLAPRPRSRSRSLSLSRLRVGPNSRRGSHASPRASPTTVFPRVSLPACTRTQVPPSPTRPAPHFWTLPFSRPRSLPLPRPRPVVAPNHRRARLDHRTFGLSRFFKGVASFCVTPLTL